MNLKLYLPLLALLITGSTAQAQKWVDMMNDPKANFYDVQKEFYDYWKNNELLKEKLAEGAEDGDELPGGYIQFKRWEYFAQPRVYPSGFFPNSTQTLLDVNQASAQQSTAVNGNWYFVGPSSVANLYGMGRLNCVRVNPTNTDIIWVGAASGGLWRSTDGGVTWSTGTDNFSNLGVNDIAFDPNNANIMYLATGDFDHSDAYSYGILKSTNAGSSWSTTGLSFTVNQGYNIGKILIDPSNSAIIYASVSDGVYKSTNAGTTWTNILPGFVYDIEFKPGTSATLYATIRSGGNKLFYRSTNSGSTWTNITSGLPQNSAVDRMQIAVSANNANTVYVLVDSVGYGQSTLYGVYRSTDGGSNFTTQATSPNILGTQGWYAMAITASPTDVNTLYVGGLWIWKSTDGGVTWTQTATTHHVDIHNFEFQPGNSSVLYTACDGGIYKTSDAGTSWSDLNEGLSIGQFYNLGISARDTDLTLTGWQDNGTARYKNGAWAHVNGGDGMECFIDPFNRCYMYAEYQNGGLRRSTNGGNSFSNAVSGITETGGWNTPWLLDPNNSSTVYAGFVNVWKSTDRAVTWTALGPFPGTNTNPVLALKVAPSNSNYIYAVKYTAIYKTTDGGATWTDITGSLPISSAFLTNIDISATDPNKIWVTFSGYTSGTKVYGSANGGLTWSDYSAGLPNLPVNCIVYQKGSSDGLYVGTDVGVYYRNSSMSSWLSWYTNLPNVIVDELEINYCTGKIRAATYGRDLWESDLYSWTGTLVTPVAEFTVGTTQCPSVANKTICPGGAVSFTNLSGCAASYLWSFPGGTPSSSTAANPVITYNTPGIYDVTLTAINTAGNNVITKTGFVIVSSPATPPNPTSNSPLCTTVTLTRTGTPASNETWYWQGTSCGTSTSLGTGTTKSATTSGTYYIRSRDNSTGCWSVGCGSVTVQIDTFSASISTPGNPTSNSPQCTNVTITRSGSPQTGETWYWQGSSCGISTSLGSASTYTANTSGTYYIRSRNTTTGCWSPDCGSVSIVTGTISSPPNPTSNSPKCSSVTVTRSGSPPIGQTWYWQGTSCGTSTALGSGTTYNATGSGTYYIRAYSTSGGCWSPTCGAISVQVDTVSASVTTPTNPTSNSPQCTSVTVTRTGSPPTGETWYWQGTNCGVSTSLGLGTTYAANSTGTYYIRSRNTSTGCWSPSCGSTAVVVNSPSIAPTGVLANDTALCYGDSVYLSVIGGSLGLGAQWKWYYGSCGGNSFGAGSSVSSIATLSGKVYVRAEGACNTTACAYATLAVNPQLAVNAGSNKQICVGESVTLGGNPTASGGLSSYNYLWTPATSLSSDTMANPIANPTVTTQYNVTVTDSAGCSKSSAVTVNVPANGGAGNWVWEGGADSDWFNPCNWDKRCLPDALSDVTVPGGLLNYPVVSGNLAHCKTLTVDVTSGASVTINTSGGGGVNVAQ